METRIDIQRGDVWYELDLSDKFSVKYNALVNKIGKVDSREIGHTNTFSLPNTSRNISAFGVNVFNARTLASTLNKKYNCNLFVDGGLFKKGFLVINNTQNGGLNVNFIDESLALIDFWNSMTYQQFFELEDGETFGDKFPDYPIGPNDFPKFETLKTKDVSSDIVITNNASEQKVLSQNYPVMLFPNNLNTIGDKFQNYVDSTPRQTDTFNPYQSRPIFNVNAMFDLACSAFGFTPNYDESVDWDRFMRTYIVAAGTDKGMFENEGFSEYFDLDGAVRFVRYYDNVQLIDSGADYFMFSTDLEAAGRCSELTAHPIYGTRIRGRYIPNYEFSDYGEIRFNYNYLSGHNSQPIDLASMQIENQNGTKEWLSISTLVNTIVTLKFDVELSPDTLSQQVTFYKKNLQQIAKENFPNFKKITGLYFENAWLVDETYYTNIGVTETYVPQGIITFDEDGQFLSNEVDLTYFAPKKTLKELISSVCQRMGILLSIDTENKNVNFFSYGKYEDMINEGDYYNWSDYFLKYNEPKFDTTYGKNYAKNNKISLTSPYQGNIYEYRLEENSDENFVTKYKEDVDNKVKNLKDVTKVTFIENDLLPYYEYENKGLGLVEYTGNMLSGLTQTRADYLSNIDGYEGYDENEVESQDSNGTNRPLPAIANINYAQLPNGVEEWYRLVDRAVRVEAKFLLPIDVVRSLDLTKPVYVNDLGGYFIIEEVSEYVNSSTPVTVKLIKLISGLKAIKKVEFVTLGDSGYLDDNQFYMQSPALFSNVGGIPNTNDIMLMYHVAEDAYHRIIVKDTLATTNTISFEFASFNDSYEWEVYNGGEFNDSSFEVPDGTTFHYTVHKASDE